MNITKLFFLTVMAISLGVIFGTSLGLFRFYSWPHTLADMEAGKSDLDPSLSPENGLSIPAVEVEKLKDFGLLPEGQTKISHHFLIKNTGTAPLKLQEISSSCRCTVAELEKTELKPGESIFAHMTVNADDIIGPFHQTVTFFTNDPQKPEVQLHMKGTVTVPLWVDTPERNIGRLIENTPFKTAVILYDQEKQPTKITEFIFEDPELAPFFQLKELPLSDEELKEAKNGASSGTKLEISILPGLPQGAFQQTLRLKTSSTKRPELKIRFHGIIGDQISIHGTGWNDATGTLNLGHVRQGEEFSRSIWIIARGEDYESYRFSIQKVVPEFVQIKLGETEKMGDSNTTRTPLTITIPAKSPKCDFFSENPQEIGRILLNTSKSDIPLQIYLRFVVF
ncbi:MAG: DUF1573 domain-containing protein [Planctomycetia bacterium]|nr:DUF1573 domain-containing protein [Planctomycetia bacterium]